MVAAGAVVTRDVPAYAIVKRNPARIAGYNTERATPLTTVKKSALPEGRLQGVDFFRLIKALDLRGDLLAVGILTQNEQSKGTVERGSLRLMRFLFRSLTVP
jgi:hypothetical protein